jgi:hypothetical protein
MKNKSKRESNQYKKINILFSLLIGFITIISFNLNSNSVEKKKAAELSLSNSEDFLVTDMNREILSNYFVILYHEYANVLSKEENDSPSQMCFLWDKEMDSELSALNHDIQKYANRNSLDPELKGYANAFDQDGLNPLRVINQLEKFRKESIAACHTMKETTGSIPGGIMRSLINGITINFLFFDLTLQEEITESLIGAGTTNFYIHSSSNSNLSFFFTIFFSIAVLLPWYVIIIIVLKFRKV